MLSVFQIFKMVFGVVASAFVLYFLVSYAGAYGDSQKDVQRSLIMKGFRQMASDVVVTGNPHDFDFSRMGTGVYYDVGPEFPVLRFGRNVMEPAVPLLFRYGDSVSVTRGVLDLGWSKLGFAEATPPMDVVFNPLEASDEVWNVMRNVTAALPDTEATDVKFGYALCGYNQTTDAPCSGCVSPPAGRFDFQRLLSSSFYGAEFAPCSARMGMGQLLVTVSAGCGPNPASGICANPDGRFFIAGSGRAYGFMDGLDIAAAIIGGTESDAGGLGGERLYLHKQRIFRGHIGLQAAVMADRARLLSGELASLLAGNRIEAGSGPAYCLPLYNNLAGALDRVSYELSEPDYYDDAPKRTLLAGALSDAAEVHSGLVHGGCEAVEQ